MGSKCDICGHAEAVHGVDPKCEADPLTPCGCTGFENEVQNLRAALAEERSRREKAERRAEAELQEMCKLGCYPATKRALGAAIQRATRAESALAAARAEAEKLATFISAAWLSWPRRRGEAMRTTVTSSDGNTLVTLDSEQTRAAAEFDAVRITQCPCCQSTDTGVFGAGKSRDDHGVSADAVCVRCRKVIGTIRVDFDTIFGREEDFAMLVQGRPRVYGADGLREGSKR